MKFQKEIDRLHNIRLNLQDGMSYELSQVITDLENLIKNDDFLNDIDKENAVEVLEVASEYLPSHYKIIVADNINAEGDLEDFITANPFLKVVKYY